MIKKQIDLPVSGDSITCSIGIGPNHLLAKIAGKLEKPNGLSWLSPENMPQALAHWPLDKLPGIARGVGQRLNLAGVHTIADLYRLDPRHARLIWHSVEGERFVRALQGLNVPLLPTARHGYGNSKVLSPENRPLKNAYFVSRWLVEKSVTRLRRDGFVARRFSLQIARLPRGWWQGSLTTFPSQDTLHFLALHKELWQQCHRETRGREFLSVGVHLGNVQKLDTRTADLFLPLPQAGQTDRERLGTIVDRINRRFGPDTVSYGLNRPHYGFFEKG